MREHDKGCNGCATDRNLRQHGGGMVRDYLAWCSKCEKSIQGDLQHTVGGKDYHRGCIPNEDGQAVRGGADGD